MFRPLAMLSTVGLLAFGTYVRAADEPKDVIARAIKAHGGEEVLTKNKAGRSSGKGKITIPGVGEVDFTQESAHMLPDKFRELLEMKVAGQNISVLTLVNGNTFTIEANGKTVDLDDKTKDAIKGVGHLLKIGKLVPLAKEKDYELSLIGEDKVEGKPVVGIRVVTKGQKDVNLYFDKTTNLLTKLEYRSTDPFTQNEINEERIIAEYGKNKDGLPIPKKVIVKHDSKTFLEIELSDVQLLEKLEDSDFKK
ncbi:MAG TPA: hypothetical protein VG122_09935 [Gemmata sp.]|jgi:hypothetical protein|nr:hypothetical protein [Gemmata sp.]